MLFFKGVVPSKVYQTHLNAPMNIFVNIPVQILPRYVPASRWVLGRKVNSKSHSGTLQPHDSGFLATDLERATAFLLKETDSQTAPARNGSLENRA